MVVSSIHYATTIRERLASASSASITAAFEICSLFILRMVGVVVCLVAKEGCGCWRLLDDIVIC